MRQNERRFKLKEGISKVCEENKEAASLLRLFNRKENGRPQIEYDQPELLSTIAKIVEASSATDDRCRMECLRTVTTLDDLHSELKSLGFSVSRSATYLRLLPSRGSTSEGYRHVQTVPVKLTRPENNLRQKVKDRMFAKSFMDDLINVCKLFGPQSVLFLSNDGRARVHLAAAFLQPPILMHMEYKVRLPDHNFVVGPRHTLIPSVYGVCEIKENGELSNSGDTFIRLRSGKHDSSSAHTHGYDMKELK